MPSHQATKPAAVSDFCPLTSEFCCRDCPPGKVITDHVYRVQRRSLIRDQQGRLVQAAVSDEYDDYCKVHYDERRRAGQI